VTHHLAVSSALSAPAREALADFLTASCPVGELLDTERGWPDGAAAAAAEELVAAGYGTIDEHGTFTLAIVPLAPQQLPSDTLDELTPALAVLDRLVADVMRRRTASDPDPDNPLGVTVAILLQLQNVLRLVVYERQGHIGRSAILQQLPLVATMLARAIRQEVHL
jgi:hypothetical protein